MYVTKLLVLTLIATLSLNPLYAKAPNKNTSVDTAEIHSLASIAAIDKNEILLSIVAAHKRTNTNVADFAKMMVDQHGSNLAQILEMTKKNRPVAGGEAEKLSAQGRQEMHTLGGLEGEQFDHAYVDAMVKGHQAALDLIDHHLMKTAKSEEIKKFLTDTRSVVEEHLDHAKKLQEEMKS